MKDCFAYGKVKNRRCAIMLDGNCECDGMCRFYKTEGKLRDERQKTLGKIAEMPEIRQQEISEKYYKGTRPWNCEISV